MAGRSRTPSPRAPRDPAVSRGAGPGRGSRRAVPVQPSFPWGFAAGIATVVVVLAAVLAYAVINTGTAAPSPLRDADKSVQGLQVVNGTLAQGHRPGHLTYAQTPSAGGPHNPQWMDCSGRPYDAPVPEENASHSLEHGAAWITYRPDLPADQVAALAKKAQAADYRLMSPYPGLPSPIVLTTWGRQLSVQSASDARIDDFLQQFTNGPQAPEKGATCSSELTTTGAEPQV